MIKSWSNFLLALALFTSVITLGLSAQAAKVCKVTDPTGTPLNVRDQPNGRVINALKNGREVNIEAITNDSKGRSWAKVSGYYKGEYRIWGWVLREFISCYES
jgi:hypothetical protein